MAIVILGSGDWGLALTRALSQKSKVTVWAENEHEQIRAQQQLQTANLAHPAHVLLQTKYARPLADDDILLIAVPSGVMRQVAEELKQNLNGARPIVISVSKGLYQPGYKTMTQLLAEYVPQCELGVISGPTIGNEINQGKPAKAILAAYDVTTLMKIKDALENDVLLFELSLKVREIEFCASLKGGIAIGAGIAAGLELGKNFTGLLLTYGMHEFMNVAGFLDIPQEQLFGIAGLGDLIATCLSTDSRNYRFGVLLSQGVPRDQALREVGMVVEGIRIAKDIAQLARLNAELPILDAISQVANDPSPQTLDHFVQAVLMHRSNL